MSLAESGVVGEFPYAIQKHDHSGHLCGYLGVPPSHPWYGKDYNDVDCKVHGGLTYGKESSDDYPCALPVKVWWFGFDCAHFGDWTRHWSSGVYRNRDYVYAEIEGMAKQAAEAARVIHVERR